MNTVYAFGGFTVVDDMVFGWTVIEGDSFYPIVTSSKEVVETVLNRTRGNLLFEDLVKACDARLEELKVLEEKELALKEKEKEEERQRVEAEKALFQKEVESLMSVALNHNAVFDEISTGLKETNSVGLKSPFDGNVYAVVEHIPYGFRILTPNYPGKTIELSSTRVYDAVERVMARWW